MSYILDALKKAESERNLGSIPNVHAQPTLTAHPAKTSLAGRRGFWMIFLLTIALAILIAFSTWRAFPFFSGKTSSPIDSPAGLKAVPPSIPEHIPPLITNPLPSSRPFDESQSAALSNKASSPKESSSQSTFSQADAPPAKKTIEEKPASKQKPPLEEEAPVTSLSALPENIRQGIPAFTVNGYIYSRDKSERTVLIDQKLLHEGDVIAQELTLEKLMPSGMILNYKGYRYRTSY